MNSRERVVTTLEHQEPDRVPVAFGGLQTSIQADAHLALRKYLKLEDGSENVIDWVQYIVDPDSRLKARFQNDVISIYPNPGSAWKLEIDPDTDTWIDEWGIKYRRAPGGYWYDFAGHPLKQGTPEELKHHPWPDPADPARFEGLAEHAKSLFERSGKALMVHGRTGGIFEQSWFLRGLENLFMDMPTSLRYVEALADRVLELKFSGESGTWPLEGDLFSDPFTTFKRTYPLIMWWLCLKLRVNTASTPSNEI